MPQRLDDWGRDVQLIPRAPHLRQCDGVDRAVFIALGSGAYAALKIPKDSVGTKQLKDAAVTPPKVDQSTIDLFEGQQGAQGAAGPQGPQGPQGPAGTINGVVAGGALNGTYPNPGIVNGAVGTAQTGTVPAARVEHTNPTSVSLPQFTPTTIPWNLSTFDTATCSRSRSRLALPRQWPGRT